MADLVDITLLAPHPVLGSIQKKDAICSVHKGVADDLIKRKIAKLKPAKNEPTKQADKGAGSGE